MEYETILSKVDLNEDFGKTLNYLQDVAEKVLTKREFNRYLKVSNRDIQECDGMDGILFNGQYFDWKEFNYKQREIVSAWLGYFSPDQLHKIAMAL